MRNGMTLASLILTAFFSVGRCLLSYFLLRRSTSWGGSTTHWFNAANESFFKFSGSHEHPCVVITNSLWFGQPNISKTILLLSLKRNQLMSMYLLIPKWLEAECHIITDSQLLIWIQIKLFWVSLQMNCSFTEQLQLIPCQCFLWLIKDLWFLLIAKQLLINHSFLYSENNWLDSPWNCIQVSIHMGCCFKD